jgi:hypothetical protein
MSQRERYIVIGTVAVVALLGLDRLFLTPLLARMTDLDDKITAARAEVQHDEDLFTRSTQANRKWKEMTAGALKRDASTTESQLIDSVGQWAQDARMSVSYKPERTEKKKEFIVVTYRATCNGSMSQLRTFLLHVQRATIPIRVTDLQISSRPEGTDNLTISMGISTAYLAPEQDKNERPGTVRPAGASAAAATFNRHRESL